MASFSVPRAPLAASSILALVLAAACGDVVVGHPDTSSATTDGAGGSSEFVVASVAETSASTGGGTSSGAGGASAVAVCTPQPEGEGSGGFKEPTCADLARLAVSHPVLHDADSDGQLDVGETAYLQVNLDEKAGVDFLSYPGVSFESATPGVTVSTGDWLYGILACQSTQVTTSIEVGSGVTPGTVVKITARVAMLNHDCPDAYAVTIPITVH